LTGRLTVAPAGSLEAFLTDRRGLYAEATDGRISWTAIRHAPWPLQPAEAEIEVNTMAASHGVTLPAVPPLLHFAARLDVQAWWPRRVASRPASPPNRNPKERKAQIRADSQVWKSYSEFVAGVSTLDRRKGRAPRATEGPSVSA
jgi:Uncharacterized conserved protein (COG2071)